MRKNSISAPSDGESNGNESREKLEAEALKAHDNRKKNTNRILNRPIGTDGWLDNVISQMTGRLIATGISIALVVIWISVTTGPIFATS